MAAPPSGDSQKFLQSPVPIDRAMSRPNSRSTRSRTERAKRLRGEMTSSKTPKNTPSQIATKDTIVHPFQAKSRPLWLMLCLRLQQTSSVAAFLLAAGVLAAYGWTVYIQQHWGQEYGKLQTLKKQKLQLVSANEALKNQMAEQAENPTAGLLLPDPSNAIFLTPAPQRPNVTPKPTAAPDDSFPTKPLGY